jgi:hypothetical protein
MEAVRRGYSIIDSETPSICHLTYTANNPVIALDKSVIVLRSAIVTGQIIPLLVNATVDWMDRVYPGWRGTTAKYPSILIRDWKSGSVRAYPNPTQSGAIDISVAREPVPMVLAADEPEIPARYHRSLVYWMRYRAYSKTDTETENEDEADKAEKRFAAEFGERRSARNEKWQEEQAGQTADTLA